MRSYLAISQLGSSNRGSVIVGPMSQFYAACKQEIKQILHEPSTPPEVRAWLREVMGRLEREVSRQIVWEYDLNVDELRDHIRDKHSSQRLWAIGRVLKYASLGGYQAAFDCRGY